MNLLSEIRAQTIALMRGGNRAAPAPGVHVKSLSASRRLRALLRSADQGGALVEMALVVPVLMALLTGIFAVGLTMNTQVNLTQAVGVGANYLQQIRTTTADPCGDVLTAMKNAAPGLVASKISLTLTMSGGTGTGSTCASAAGDLGQGLPQTVYATYPCTLLIYGTHWTTACQLAAKVTVYEY